MAIQQSESGPMDLDRLVDYQEDAVVSRTLIKEDAGTVTLFAFDQGQELSEHTAPYDALIHVIDGAAEIAIQGVWHHVCAGHALIMPVNLAHAVRADQRFKMLLTMVKARSDANP